MLELDIRGRAFTRPDGSSLHAVGALQLTVPAGSFTCITGPSGCGKTTTLNMVMGLDEHFDGEVRWRDATGARQALPRLAAVFQEPRLLPWRSVEQNVRLPLPAEHREAPLDELFEALQIDTVRQFFPGELSLGMARRVALARAFALEPSLLILDEPFVSLDESTAARLRGLLLRLWQSRPTTTLMVTHNLVEAVELADEVIVFSARPATVRARIPIPLARSQRTPSAIDMWVETIRQQS